jgi:alpha-beta hydrolase superfamily lysophospholipase
VQEYEPVKPTQSPRRRKIKRLLIIAGILAFSFFFIVMPVALSFLITNSRFRFPERNVRSPENVGLQVQDVEFRSDDGIALRGWWNSGDPAKPVIVFVHGLNRSRLEHVERAAESSRRGYGVLLIDLRNHGDSDRAYTTLGVNESHDVCAARDFLRKEAPGRPQVLWGVSLGASTALLAERHCRGSAAIISDSSFLSFSETIKHHFTLVFRLPSFPIANIIVAVTTWRMGFRTADGDIEAAVSELGDLPILFIAGGADVRMPPELAERLASHSSSPAKKLLVVPGAAHGQAFAHDRETYLRTAFEFIERATNGWK